MRHQFMEQSIQPRLINHRRPNPANHPPAVLNSLAEVMDHLANRIDV